MDEKLCADCKKEWSSKLNYASVCHRCKNWNGISDPYWGSHQLDSLPREEVIGHDDILNLQIALYSNKTFEEFLEII